MPPTELQTWPSPVSLEPLESFATSSVPRYQSPFLNKEPLRPAPQNQDVPWERLRGSLQGVTPPLSSLSSLSSHISTEASLWAVQLSNSNPATNCRVPHICQKRANMGHPFLVRGKEWEVLYRPSCCKARSAASRSASVSTPMVVKVVCST